MKTVFDWYGNEIGQFNWNTEGVGKMLSNFWPCKIIDLKGREWKSAEHAYQGSKFTDAGLVESIRAAQTAKDAKRIAKGHAPREGWDDMKVGVMERILRLKFQIPELREALLSTGKMILLHDCPWGDDFWGLVGARGVNWLGRLLMKIRTEVQQEVK